MASDSLAANIPPQGPPPNLWKAAFDSLSSKEKEVLSPAVGSTHNISNAVLGEVESSVARSKKRRWSYKRKSGEKIIIRDILEKVAKCIRTYVKVGDVAVAYDPSHAALPWAGIRSLLQITINDIEIYGAMFGGIEKVSKLITSYTIFERLYLQDPLTETQSLLCDSLKKSTWRFYNG